MKLDPLFLIRCSIAIGMMRTAGINETLIACIIQDIRSAALSEEFSRLSELLRVNPPHHHSHGEIQDAIKEHL